jgi:hypothetical protein
MLIAFYLVLLLFPAHLHYHHEHHALAASGENQLPVASAFELDSHSHEVDIHVLTDDSADDPHTATHVYNASPDVLAPKSNDSPVPVLLFIMLLAFITVFARQIGPNPHATSSVKYRHFSYFTPPLRAPPAH